jgi:hypothetical protein
MSEHDRIVDLARAAGASVVSTPAATVIVLPVSAPTSKPTERLTIADAAHVAATKPSILRRAINHGELPASGGKRDRSILRSDLEKWIASRTINVRPSSDFAREVEAELSK